MTEEAPEIFEGLREHRLEGILSDLTKWAAEPIEFAFDPRGTHLFSIEEAKRAYAKRYLALHGSARRLLDDDVVSASVLGRAIIETIAMGVFFVDEMERLVVAGNLENLERRVSRFLVGLSTDETNKPVHVMDALRHLHDVDARYVRYLWEKYPMMRDVYSGLIGRSSETVRPDDMMASISITANYDLLSEFAHPNGLGTYFIFPAPGHVAEPVEKTKARLAMLTKASFWQGHHLLSALDRARGFAARYEARFGLPERG